MLRVFKNDTRIEASRNINSSSRTQFGSEVLVMLRFFAYTRMDAQSEENMTFYLEKAIKFKS